jgi:Sulfotransferase family
MVINDRLKFLFVHIPKAAGLSIQAALRPVDGENRQWLGPTTHETLAQFEQRINAEAGGRRIFVRDEWFCFAFVRHPWERLSSFYRYLVEKRPRAEIDTVASFRALLAQCDAGVEWVTRLRSMRPQLDFITSAAGAIDADFVGHYEYLQKDFADVAARLGIDVELPHLHRTTNSDHDYRQDYDDWMIDFVAERFADDIRHFGYTFESREPAERRSGPLKRRRAPA